MGAQKHENMHVKKHLVVQIGQMLRQLFSHDAVPYKPSSHYVHTSGLENQFGLSAVH